MYHLSCPDIYAMENQNEFINFMKEKHNLEESAVNVLIGLSMAETVRVAEDLAMKMYNLIMNAYVDVVVWNEDYTKIIAEYYE
ncbi:hypothetical protein P9Y11_23020 [Bacillus cereus]|nr:hypothetical protein [Bacillus cereus]